MSTAPPYPSERPADRTGRAARSAGAPPGSADRGPAGRLATWAYVLRTTNLPEGGELDPVSKWLVATRASVLPMTFFAAGIGGVLAAAAHPVDLWLLAVCTLGLMLAHVSNNLMNDWFDTRGGVDTPGYARTQYAPHPLLSGIVTEREMLRAILLVNALDLCIALYLGWVRGPLVLAFALAGFAISYFYVAPPLRLKHHGLGEPSVLVIWGPLMTAGSYFIASGELPAWVWLASLPYGLLVMAVLFGKHIDKLEADSAKGIHTLPVLLGATQARRATQALIAGFFATSVLFVAAGILTPWVLLSFLAVARVRKVWRVFDEPAPSEPPRNYPLWPLWYVAAAFVMIRQVGTLFVLGLLISALLT